MNLNPTYLYNLQQYYTSVLTHTYPHKPLRKIEVTICSHQADSPLYVWPDVWSRDLQVQKNYGHAWHRMSLLRPGVIKQCNPNQVHAVQMASLWYARWLTLKGAEFPKIY